MDEENLAIEEALDEEIMEARTEQEEDLKEEIEEGIPEPEERYEKFKFLTEVRDLEDTIRTSYLTKTELGVPLFSVRFWENLRLIASIRGYKILEKFLKYKALATTHTGLSREGFLLNTAITRRKEKIGKKVPIQQQGTQKINK